MRERERVCVCVSTLFYVMIEKEKRSERVCVVLCEREIEGTDSLVCWMVFSTRCAPRRMLDARLAKYSLFTS